MIEKEIAVFMTPLEAERCGECIGRALLCKYQSPNEFRKELDSLMKDVAEVRKRLQGYTDQEKLIEYLKAKEKTERLKKELGL